MTEMSRQESDMQKVVSQTVTCSHNVGVQMMRRSIQIKWCQSRRQINWLFYFEALEKGFRESWGLAEGLDEA